MNLIKWGARLRGDDQITAHSTRDRIEEAGSLGCCVHVQNFGSVLAADCAGRLDTEYFGTSHWQPVSFRAIRKYKFLIYGILPPILQAVCNASPENKLLS